MGRNLGIMILFVFHGVACGYHCNYNILMGNTETYLFEIVKQIPDNVNKHQVEQDLNFISSSGEDNILEKYKSKNFEALHKRSVTLVSRYNGVSKAFIETCKVIYDSSKNPIIRLSVHMLLYDLTEELLKHAANVDAMKSAMCHTPTSS
jgi:hypothetical protein